MAGMTRTNKYVKLSFAEKIQTDCDMKATNIIIQGLPAVIYSLVNHYRVAKDLWERVQLLMQGTSLTKQERECLAVLVFSPGDDLIACLNKAMAFLTAVAFSRENNASGQEAGQILDEDQLAFLADPGVPDGQAIQTIIPNNAAFQNEDLDTYDSDCDDISNAKAVLMANISNYGSDVISEVPYSDTYLINDMENQSVHAMQDYEQSPVVDFTDNEIHSDSNIIPSREKMIDSQMDDMIKEKLASLEQNLSKQIKEKESLLQTFSFDSVVKKRTTPDARIEDLLNEIMEVQIVFDQMEAAVQQSSVDKQCLEIAKKELLLENDRLLQQIMSQDVLLTVMNSMSLNGESVNMERKRNESCDKLFDLDAELFK
ncbi:hypothetical protein Tco_0781498 [Tanacetum coccineum]